MFAVLLHFKVITAKLPFWTAMPSQIIRTKRNSHANQFLVFFHLNFLFDST